MVKEEKALLKVAAEAPEQFDSHESVLQEARRVADWIKLAKHCVAFTGIDFSLLQISRAVEIPCPTCPTCPNSMRTSNFNLLVLGQGLHSSS